MTIDPNNEKHIIADEGKMLRRKSTGLILGEEVFLGLIMENGVMVEDKASNFDEVEAEIEPVNND